MDQKAYIDQAAEHFRTLLAQQLQRQERMAQGSPAKDFAHMDHIVIGLIPGDGIGPIIMAQARGCWKSCWRTRSPMAGWNCGTSRA